jgi:hypothetical protein
MWRLAVNNRWINQFVIARWRTIFFKHNLENNELFYYHFPRLNDTFSIFFVLFLSCIFPRNCFVKIGVISFWIIPFRFVSVNFVSIYFVSFRFRFVSVNFVSFRLISFRFVSFRFRFAFYRYPNVLTYLWSILFQLYL